MKPQLKSIAEEIAQCPDVCLEVMVHKLNDWLERAYDVGWNEAADAAMKVYTWKSFHGPCQHQRGEVMESECAVPVRNPPPNPFYLRQYRTTVKSGEAYLSIQAPGGRVDPQSASDLCEWLRLVLSQLERDIAKGESTAHERT